MQKNISLFLLPFCITFALSAAQSSQERVVQESDTIFANGVEMFFEIYTETVKTENQKLTTTKIKKTYKGSQATIVKINKYDSEHKTVLETVLLKVIKKDGSTEIVPKEHFKSFSPTWTAEYGDKPRTCASPYFFGKEKTD